MFSAEETREIDQILLSADQACFILNSDVTLGCPKSII
jgi:hypothetical protein